MDDFRIPFLANAAIAAVAAGALALLFVANSDPLDGTPFRYNFLAAWPAFITNCLRSKQGVFRSSMSVSVQR
jgi:hypothetical protein